MRISVDDYVVDTLMADLVGHDRMPSAFVVYLFLWRRIPPGRQSVGALSLRDIAEGTGLSKRAVQVAIGLLERRRLLAVTHPTPTAIAQYAVLRPWRRDRGR